MIICRTLWGCFTPLRGETLQNNKALIKVSLFEFWTVEYSVITANPDLSDLRYLSSSINKFQSHFMTGDYLQVAIVIRKLNRNDSVSEKSDYQ